MNHDPSQSIQTIQEGKMDCFNITEGTEDEISVQELKIGEDSNKTKNLYSEIDSDKTSRFTSNIKSNSSNKTTPSANIANKVYEAYRTDSKVLFSSSSSDKNNMEISSHRSMPTTDIPCLSHNQFVFDNIVFSSNFDNGNLLHVERILPMNCSTTVTNSPVLSLTYPSNSPIIEFKIWTARDNQNTVYEARNNNGWFYFSVSGIESGTVLRIYVKSTSHQGLYRHDMRPVFRSKSTSNQWIRIKSPVRYTKSNESNALPLPSSSSSSTSQSTSNQPNIMYFEHMIDQSDDTTTYLAFTYPYTYTMLQEELQQTDTMVSSDHILLYDRNNIRKDEMNIENHDNIIYYRELLINSCEGRRIDLITITSSVDDQINSLEREPVFDRLFPDNNPMYNTRPYLFPEKEIVFISARVHPGEVPAQHTFKGIYHFLLDRNDLRAKELRKRYVFKLIPMLNPDGVYRGHFRQDQQGQNLNRHYLNPDPTLQPAIFAAKSLLDYYAQQNKLAFYLDLHAHASKKGCFIYGNVMDNIEDQVQNQLYCKLISLNTPHFDYESCLFSKEHMTRIEPGDKGMTAEGSGRVNTYLSYGLLHSYTLECNYNMSRRGNEVSPVEYDPKGDPRYASIFSSPSSFTPLPEKYSPQSYWSVGVACLVAMLDIKGQNPCSRIPKSKYKSFDKIRSAMFVEVKLRKEYKNQPIPNQSITNSTYVWNRIVLISKESDEGNSNDSSSKKEDINTIEEDNNHGSNQFTQGNTTIMISNNSVGKNNINVSVKVPTHKDRKLIFPSYPTSNFIQSNENDHHYGNTDYILSSDKNYPIPQSANDSNILIVPNRTQRFNTSPLTIAGRTVYVNSNNNTDGNNNNNGNNTSTGNTSHVPIRPSSYRSSSCNKANNKVGHVQSISSNRPNSAITHMNHIDFQSVNQSSTMDKSILSIHSNVFPGSTKSTHSAKLKSSDRMRLNSNSGYNGHNNNNVIVRSTFGSFGMNFLLPSKGKSNRIGSSTSSSSTTNSNSIKNNTKNNKGPMNGKDVTEITPRQILVTDSTKENA